MAKCKTSRNPPSNIASENSTPNANGIRVFRCIGRRLKSEKKKDFQHNLREERAVAGVFFGVIAKLSPLQKVCFGGGIFGNSSAWTIGTPFTLYIIIVPGIIGGRLQHLYT